VAHPSKHRDRTHSDQKHDVTTPHAPSTSLNDPILVLDDEQKANNSLIHIIMNSSLDPFALIFNFYCENQE